MKKEEYETKLQEITKKIGDEASNLILDDIGVLLSDNVSMNKEIETKDAEIKSLKAKTEMLQNVNGNLLQQVAVAHVEAPKKEEEKKKPLDYKTLFDKNGDFI